MKTKNSKVHLSNETIEQISADQLEAILTQGTFTIIDVRAPQGIKSQGSIPGAINIPLEEVKKQIDERNENPDFVLNGEGPFLFCCTGGVMSYMAAIHAQEKGVKRVYNLEGGHAAWKKLKEAHPEAQPA